MKIKHITNGSLVNASNVAKYDVDETLVRFTKSYCHFFYLIATTQHSVYGVQISSSNYRVLNCRCYQIMESSGILLSQ